MNNSKNQVYPMAKLVQKFYLSRDSGISWLENEQTKMGLQNDVFGLFDWASFSRKEPKTSMAHGLQYCLVVF